MNIVKHDEFWLIEDTEQYDPYTINDAQKKKDIVKESVDEFVNEFIGDREYEEGTSVISAAPDKLEKVSTPVIESYINHLNKTNHIRYCRSIKIF